MFAVPPQQHLVEHRGVKNIKARAPRLLDFIERRVIWLDCSPPESSNYSDLYKMSKKTKPIIQVALGLQMKARDNRVVGHISNSRCQHCQRGQWEQVGGRGHTGYRWEAGVREVNIIIVNRHSQQNMRVFTALLKCLLSMHPGLAEMPLWYD